MNNSPSEDHLAGSSKGIENESQDSVSRGSKRSQKQKEDVKNKRGSSVDHSIAIEDSDSAKEEEKTTQEKSVSQTSTKSRKSKGSFLPITPSVSKKIAPKINKDET